MTTHQPLSVPPSAGGLQTSALMTGLLEDMRYRWNLASPQDFTQTVPLAVRKQLPLLVEVVNEGLQPATTSAIRQALARLFSVLPRPASGGPVWEDLMTKAQIPDWAWAEAVDRLIARHRWASPPTIADLLDIAKDVTVPARLAQVKLAAALMHQRRLDSSPKAADRRRYHDLTPDERADFDRQLAALKGAPQS